MKSFAVVALALIFAPAVLAQHQTFAVNADASDVKLHRFVLQCLRFVLSSDSDMQAAFSFLLSGEYIDLPSDESKSSVMKQLTSRRESAVNANYHSDKLKALDELIERCEFEIPF